MYKLISGNLYKLQVNGQMKHISKVPSQFNTLSKALAWLESQES